MGKDRFGIRWNFYAVVAFILAILGQTLLSGLLLAFAVMVQHHEWLIRQTMQAFFLVLISDIISLIIGACSWSYDIPFLGTVLSITFGVIHGIISIVILIFAIIGLCNVVREKDAKVPICKYFADKAFGLDR